MTGIRFTERAQTGFIACDIYLPSCTNPLFGFGWLIASTALVSAAALVALVVTIATS